MGSTTTRNEDAPPALVADAKGLSRMGFGSVRHIQRMNSAGHLPKPLKLGARVVWSLDELRAWIAAGAPDRATWDAIKRATGNAATRP